MATVDEIDRGSAVRPRTEAGMQEFTHIHRRPAKALVLVASVAALTASTATGANGVPLGAAQQKGDDGFTTGAYGAPPAISLTPSGPYTVDPGRRAGPTPSVTIVEPSAFDWGDAGVGAAGTFGLMLIAGGVVTVSRHNRRRAM